MFHRRHVYEHNAGEVDQKYLDDSRDTTVQLKQHIHETRKDVHDLLGFLAQMFWNLHSGFHEILPPPRRADTSLRRKKGACHDMKGQH